MMSYLSILFNNTKLVIFSEVSKKNFKVVYAEDAAVADFPALAGGKYLYVSPASVETVSQRDAVMEFEDRAVGFLSPLRYESGQRPITKLQYRQGRRS